MFEERGRAMEERLRLVLRERVEEYLAAAERLLGSSSPPGGWDVVRARLRPLLDGWRALLAVHVLDRRRCRHCDRYRALAGLGLLRAARQGPCSVWRTANATLVARFPERAQE